MGELYTQEKTWIYTLEGIKDLVKSRVQSNFETSNWYHKEIEENRQVLTYDRLVNEHTVKVLDWYLNKVVHGQDKALTNRSYCIINGESNPNIWFLSADEVKGIVVPRIIRSMTRINAYVNEVEQKHFNKKYCIQKLEDLKETSTQSIIELMKYYGTIIEVNNTEVEQYEYIPKWLSNQKEYEYQDIFKANRTGIHYSSSELFKILEEQRENLNNDDLESDDYNNDYMIAEDLQKRMEMLKTHGNFHSKWLDELTTKLDKSSEIRDKLFDECNERIFELTKRIDKLENLKDTCTCRKVQGFSINNNPDEIQRKYLEKQSKEKEEVLKSEFERLEYIAQKKFEKKLNSTYTTSYEKVSYEVYNTFQSKFPEETKQLRIEYREPEDVEKNKVWLHDIFVYIPNIVECLQRLRESKYVEFIQMSSKNVLIKYTNDASVKNLRQVYSTLTEAVLGNAYINDIIPVSYILK